jgi:hypothetical protein
LETFDKNVWKEDVIINPICARLSSASQNPDTASVALKQSDNASKPDFGTARGQVIA